MVVGTSQLSGQTGTTLTLNNVQFSNAGDYTSGRDHLRWIQHQPCGYSDCLLPGANDPKRRFQSAEQRGFGEHVCWFHLVCYRDGGRSEFKQTNATVRTYGAYTVTLTGNGTDPGYVDRLRATPTNNTVFTQAQLLQDFVFSQDTSANGGLNVTIAGLTPGQVYGITIWSYDTGSVRPRTSDWYVNGSQVVDNYMFDGTTNQPASDSEFPVHGQRHGYSQRPDSPARAGRRPSPECCG